MASNGFITFLLFKIFINKKNDNNEINNKNNKNKCKHRNLNANPTHNNKTTSILK